ncbi:MAG TPA: expansin-like protein [Fibrobacteria bacterium]|nr:expansin-like protein [Fibrobacteria bacterium]
MTSPVQGDLGILVIDLTTPTIPLLSDTGGIGDVTTYGGVGNANPSSGGACNYGITGIANYAAIQVSQAPGDLLGQWNGGRMCGQCARIRAWTSTGWHATVARIVDKCPDDRCGIDLGGSPATDIMGALPGRYSGDWTFVPCTSLSGVSDGPRTLWVKEGASAYWSLIQVRDPPSAVDSMRMRFPGGTWSTLSWATEAENFFTVPVNLLQDTTATLQVEIHYRMAAPDTLQTKAASFTHGETSIEIP